MRPKPRAFIFDIDGTLVDSNSSISIPGIAPFAISGKDFRARHYARRSARAPINICLNFSRLKKSSASAKSSTSAAPSFFEKNIFPASARSRTCANFFSAFAMMTSESSSLAQVRKKTRNITSKTCSRSHGERAPRSQPSHPKNPTITPTVSINPCANTGAQRFRPVSKYADPRMKPATLESRIPVGPL